MTGSHIDTHWLDDLFIAIDRKDVEAFTAFLHNDARFRFGSAPVVQGRDAIGMAVGAFFDSIASLSHSISKVWSDANGVTCEGEVCYRRHDNSEVILPFVDVFELDDGYISAYKIYIDISPLYAT